MIFSVCIFTIGNALLSKKSKLQLARGTMEWIHGVDPWSEVQVIVSFLSDAKFLLNFNVFSGANAQIVPLS